MKYFVLVLLLGTAAARSNLEGGGSLRASTQNQLNDYAAAEAGYHSTKAGGWETWHIAALAAVVCIGGILLGVVLFKSPSEKEIVDPTCLEEVEEERAELIHKLEELQKREEELTPPKIVDPEADDEEDDGKSLGIEDYEKTMRLLTQSVVQQVGPKLAKAQALKSCVETRINGFQGKAKSFMKGEVNSCIAALLKAIGAEEAMLLFDYNEAAKLNFPPASVLLAGLLSPVVLSISLANHIGQIVLALLPVVILGVWAIHTDWGVFCGIPTMSTWIYAQTGIAAVLLLAHTAMAISVKRGKSQIQAKATEVQDLLKDAMADGELSVSEMRDLFKGNAVLLQNALLIEDRLRHSFFNTLIGVGTLAWLVVIIWTFVISAIWVIVPGVTAFHPKAHEVAGGAFCGKWATVFVSELSCIFAVLFLFMNLLTVALWICSMFMESPSFANAVLKQARSFDEIMLGIPVCETLMKAFILRGSSDTLSAQFSGIKREKAVMEKQRSELQSKKDSLDSQIAAFDAEVAALEPLMAGKMDSVITMPAPLPVAESAASGSDGPDFQEKAAAAVEQAKAEAEKIKKETSEQLQVMIEKIMAMAEQLRNSDAMQNALEQARAAQEQLAEKAKTMDAQKMKEALAQAQEAAVAAANQAKDAAMEGAKQLQENEQFKAALAQGQDAVNQAQTAAIEGAKQLQENEQVKAALAQGQEGLEKAKAAAVEGAQQLQDNEQVKAALAQGKEAAAKAQSSVEEAAKQVGENEQVKAAIAQGKEAASKAQSSVEEAAKQVQESEQVKAAVAAGTDAVEKAKEATKKQP